MDFENVRDVLGARLIMLLERDELTTDEVMITKSTLMKLFRDGGDELMEALKNAMWLDETAAESHALARPMRETWPQDEFGREIDPALSAPQSPPGEFSDAREYVGHSYVDGGDQYGCAAVLGGTVRCGAGKAQHPR